MATLFSIVFMQSLTVASGMWYAFPFVPTKSLAAPSFQKLSNHPVFLAGKHDLEYHSLGPLLRSPCKWTQHMHLENNPCRYLDIIHLYLYTFTNWNKLDSIVLWNWYFEPTIEYVTMSSFIFFNYAHIVLHHTKGKSCFQIKWHNLHSYIIMAIIA